MAVPADTPVTMPALVTVATAGLLLVQVPPLAGVKVVVIPIQILVAPVIATTGKAFTVTGAVAAEVQPAALVKVKVAVPIATPVTTPALVTVATAGLPLVQVPPVVGDKLVVIPTQILLVPVINTTGAAFTVTADVGAEAQPAALVKINVAVPADIPVTTPAFVTVATAALLLAQVPPELGDKVVVEPMQILLAPTRVATGAAFTVTAEVGADTQPVTELVKVKVAVPAVTPVTTPALLTVATAALLLAQVPPVVGDKLVVLPTQIALAPVILTTGGAFTVTADVGAEAQPAALVKIKVAPPAPTPVTTPALVTVATAALLLAQVPPVVGDKVVVPPTQIVLLPVRLAAGMALTVMEGVAAETQPVAVLVKVKVADPAATPVTTPAALTVATAGLLLVQVPPLVGETPLMAPTQILLVPVIVATGEAFTVTAEVGAETQPAALVKVNVAVPADTPVTIPALVTVATPALLLAQVPPVVGDKVVGKADTNIARTRHTHHWYSRYCNRRRRGRNATGTIRKGKRGCTRRNAGHYPCIRDRSHRSIAACPGTTNGW